MIFARLPPPGVFQVSTLSIDIAHQQFATQAKKYRRSMTLKVISLTLEFIFTIICVIFLEPLASRELN